MKKRTLQDGVRALVLLAGFAIPLAGHAAVTETQLASFRAFYGVFPSALVQGSDGNFYGTTVDDGGWKKGGTVFKLTPAGKLMKLHAFNEADGENPKAGLVQGPDGAFYGTTSFALGGQYSAGSVFRITSLGQFLTLYTFTGGADGGHPNVRIIVGADGALYGTTSSTGGAVTGGGTIFRITTSGSFSTFYAFGSNPELYANTLIQGADGNFYGTTQQGGDFRFGSLFKLTPAGDFSTLYSFNGDSSNASPTDLHQNSSGDLFGTTSESVFTAATDGSLMTTLATFPQSNLNLATDIMQASDGNYYCETSEEFGADIGASVYRLTPSGTLTTLFTFSLDSSSPNFGVYPSELIQGKDGLFYGSTARGGAYSCGSSMGGGNCGGTFKITITP